MISLQMVDEYFSVYYNRMLCTYLVDGLRGQILAGGGISGKITIDGNKDCMTP
jgi:hypothetical protein